MRQQVSSWGRLSSALHETTWLQDRTSAADRISQTILPGIAIGNARSYGDVCLNNGGTAWRTRRLDKFISFDPASGLLECEAGVTLKEITDLVLPQGWFLPVTPGTQYVTVGGAIANDVHGKNHHSRGSFGDHVTGLTLLRTDGETIACGPSSNAEWFRATVGGMGLTGIVADAGLQLRRVNGPWVDSQVDIFESLEQFFELSRTQGASWEYTVAWIDCMAMPGGRARGVFFSGRHSDRTAPVPVPKARSAAWLPPVCVVTTRTSSLFNALYFRRHRQGVQRATQPYWAFFYPLDAISEWNRMYGPSGFYQYQCVVPEQGQLETVRALLEVIKASGAGSFLSVLKTFGARPPAGLMSFPMAGTTLALDFPNKGEESTRLFARLNALVAEAGGRLYPAKDAVMSAVMFCNGYPQAEQFRRYRDPGIESDMSRRLFAGRQ
ncbi:MAG: FAD-binding oxidoreductase [Proteobacteria bacterium]|nr:FAD-binding oxidoreductase [Burkholderiales bacterium]